MENRKPFPSQGRWMMPCRFLANPRVNSGKLGNKWGIRAAKPLKIAPQGMRSLDEMQKKMYYL